MVITPPRLFPTGYRITAPCLFVERPPEQLPLRSKSETPLPRGTVPTPAPLDRDMVQIAKIAHSLFLLRGSQPGQESAYWLEAAGFWRRLSSRGPVRLFRH